MADHEIKQSKLFNFLDTFGNLFVLNLLYILFSLPVVTIGASTTALYSVTTKMIKKEEGTICSSFFEAFKKNFKKASILWGAIVLFVVIILGQYFLIVNYDGVITKIYGVIMVICIAAFFLSIPFVFQLQARFENTITNTIKNSFLLSVSNLGAAIKIVTAWAGPILISIIYPKVFLFTWFVWIVFMFALIAYLASMATVRVFDRVLANSKNSEENDTEIDTGEEDCINNEHIEKI